MQYIDFLDDAQVATVHGASLEILEEVGLLVRNGKARRRFAENGARVDNATEIVRIPAPVVEKFRAMVPPTIALRGRDPAYDVTFPRALPVVATASAAPDIVDPVSGVTRRATSADIANIAHRVNHPPGFDVFSISTLAEDAPKGQFGLSRFYPALKNCVKPCRTSVIDVREAEQVLKLGALIAGSKEAYRERPFINLGYCSIVSSAAPPAATTAIRSPRAWSSPICRSSFRPPAASKSKPSAAAPPPPSSPAPRTIPTAARSCAEPEAGTKTARVHHECHLSVA
jgi:trimethylamine--corrinoid protein Co-methyltransferase